MYRSWGKRALDLMGAVVLIVATAPIAAVIAVAILLHSGRPVLFRQRRPGLHGESFTLFKFRTLSEDRAPGGAYACDQERLTRFGSYLRATSLDELPELFNVVRGEMSIVGPRPLLPEYLPLYSRRQASRHEVQPGITGLVQVDGRNSLNWAQKFARDVWYVRNYGPRVDAWILYRTFAAVIRRDGISSEGHATAPPFSGSILMR